MLRIVYCLCCKKIWTELASPNSYGKHPVDFTQQKCVCVFAICTNVKKIEFKLWLYTCIARVLNMGRPGARLGNDFFLLQGFLIALCLYKICISNSVFFSLQIFVKIFCCSKIFDDFFSSRIFHDILFSFKICNLTIF